MVTRRIADASIACVAGLIFAHAGVSVGADSAPSHLGRSGVEAFLPYNIGNVRGLDASRILGIYRWNGLPVLGQTRGASAATERFDVLAGLAALEAGEVVPGGVVERVDKKTEPRVTRPSLVLSGALRSRSVRQVTADASIATPAVGWRITAFDERGETAREGLRVATSYASGTATIEPVPGFDLTGSLELRSDRERGEQAGLYLNGLKAPSAPSASTLFGQTWDGSHSHDRIASVRWRWRASDEWQVSGGALRIDYRHRQADFLGVLEPSGRYDLQYLFDPAQRSVSDTLHLQADGTARTAGLTHRLRLGTSRLVSRALTTGIASTSIGLSSLAAPVEFAPVTLAASGAQYEAERLRDSNVFVSDSIGLGERWTVLASLRGGLYRQDGANVIAPVEETYLLKSFGVRAALSARLTLYASYGEALERGGTAPVSSTNALRVLPVFRSRQDEIGARLALSERLSLETALFEARRRYEYEDAARTFRQDGVVRHRGIELRAVGAVSGVRLYGSVLALDARVTGASDPAVDGTRALNVPPRRARVIAETPLPWGEGWSASANLDAVSWRPADAANAARIPGYAVLGLGLAYAWRDRAGTSLRIDVENVANKGYWSDASGSYLYLGDPRTVFLRFATAL